MSEEWWDHQDKHRFKQECEAEGIIRSMPLDEKMSYLWQYLDWMKLTKDYKEWLVSEVIKDFEVE